MENIKKVDPGPHVMYTDIADHLGIPMPVLNNNHGDIAKP
jgi:hypothetical protein